MVDIVFLYISIWTVYFMFTYLSTKVQMLKQSTISSEHSCANIATNILVTALVSIFIISLCDVILSFLHAKDSLK